MVAMGPACAQDNTGLIDTLVCKKILTPTEAECIRADVLTNTDACSASKIKLGDPVTKLTLYGDARLRFQYDNVDPQLGVLDPVTGEIEDPGHGDQRCRSRFRLRLNADFTLKDNWFGGAQLQTSQNSDSTSQTFTGGFRNYDIYIARAFIGWNTTDWLTLIGGKQANPFYNADMVWCPATNPSGVVETVKFHKLLHCCGKDSAGGQPFEFPWTLTLVTGQFFFDDNQEYNPPGFNTDAYLFQEQLLFSYKFCNDIKLVLAPAYLCYNSAQVNRVFNILGFAKVINDIGSDDLPLGWGETRNLSLIQLPGDLSFRVCGWTVKFIWDGVYNTAGAKRVNDTYVFPIRDKQEEIIGYEHITSHCRKDDFAWLVGLQLGENVKKGDWTFSVNYRQVGIGALDPNLNDSDWALSRLNQKGWRAMIAYNFTDATVLQVTGYTSDNLRKNLIGGQATSGAKLADANSAQVLQVDLVVKF